MAKQKYTEDFKKTIINLNQAGSSVEELAREYGLSPQTIYKWKKLHTPHTESGITQAEFLAFQKKLAHLEEDNSILKKSIDHIREKITVSQMIEAVKNEPELDNIKRTCQLLGISRSSFYEKLNRKPSKRDQENQELDQAIRKVFDNSRQIYGAPKIHHLVKKEFGRLSLKRVQRRMSIMGLRSKITKKWRPTSNKKNKN